MKILFSIYTRNHGHQVLGFDSFDKDGRSAFQQVQHYARETYNDQQDKQTIYVLSQITTEESL